MTSTRWFRCENLTAFAIRLSSTCISRRWSPCTSGPPGPHLDGDALLGGGGRGRPDRLGDQVGDRDRRQVQRQRAGLEPVQHEQVADEPVQPVGVPLDDVEEADPLRGEPLGFAPDQLAERDDRGQRRAQLVRHDGQELVPGLVELAQPLVLLGELPLGLEPLPVQRSCGPTCPRPARCRRGTGRPRAPASSPIRWCGRPRRSAVPRSSAAGPAHRHRPPGEPDGVGELARDPAQHRGGGCAGQSAARPGRTWSRSSG